MTSDNSKYQEMMNGAMCEGYINKAIHSIYQDVFMSDTNQEVRDLVDTKERLVKILEDQIKETASKATPKNDIFGRKSKNPTILDPKQNYNLVIELGDTPEDTVIKTKKGEVLDMVTNMQINYDADKPFTTVTLTFLNAKIVSKKEPAVEQPIKDSYLRSKLDPHISMESLHASLVNGEKPVIIPKEYNAQGGVVSDGRQDKPGRWG